MRAFEATARTLSFTKAAKDLGVGQSAISRQVRRLEDLLGATLIHRRGREIRLSEPGSKLLARLSTGFDLIARTLQEIVEQQRHQTIRISIATSFAHCLGPGLVAGFLREHPSVHIDIDSRGAIESLENSDYDMVIVYARPHVSVHVMDLLWQERLTPLCRPDLVPEDGPIDVSGFLKGQTLLHTRTEAGRYHAWESWAKAADVDPMATHRGLSFDTSMLAVRYALQHEGIAMADRRLYEAEIKAGGLCAPIDRECRSEFGYYLVMRQEDLANEILREFRTWIVTRFAQ